VIDMAEITGILNVNNALVPQDVEIEPGAEDIIVEPAEGCYLRSVTVKAIPATPNEPDIPDTPDTPPDTPDNNDNGD
jgi:hypothetical protein